MRVLRTGGIGIGDDRAVAVDSGRETERRLIGRGRGRHGLTAEGEVDVIGRLPPEIQVATVFSAAVCTASNCPAAAKALLSFLASPEADAAKRRHGMEPA